MPQRKTDTRQSALCVLSLLLLTSVGARAQTTRDLEHLDQLLRAFAAAPGFEAPFVEEKHLSLLVEPLQSHGIIYYTPPGRLARHLSQPQWSLVLIDADSVRFYDEHTSRTIDMGAQPTIRIFVNSFVDILRGDRAALQKAYHLAFHQTDARWELDLEPRLSPMKEVIRRIEVRGSGLVLRELNVIEIDGDETRTRFRSVNLERRFTPAELRRLFSPPTR